MRIKRSKRRRIGDIGYHRPVRDRILAAARAESRDITAEEKRELYAESWRLAKAGWHIGEIHDDDHRAIEETLDFNKRLRRSERSGGTTARQDTRSEDYARQRHINNERAELRRMRERERDETFDKLKGTLGAWLL